jgi:hypothetical protein
LGKKEKELLAKEAKLEKREKELDKRGVSGMQEKLFFIKF